MSFDVISAVDVVVVSDDDHVHPDEAVADRPLLRIETSDGIVGWAEVFGIPVEVAVTVFGGLTSTFGRRLDGQRPLPAAIHRRLRGDLTHGDARGWAMMCIGAVDVAMWDIFGQAAGVSVTDLLGGSELPSTQQQAGEAHHLPRPYCTVYSKSVNGDELIRRQLDKIEIALAHGYQAVKVEPMRSEIDTIIELSRAARTAVGDSARLMVDVGYLWNEPSEARPVLAVLEDLGVEWLETPFPTDRLDAYRRLQAETTVPLTLGEYGVGADHFRQIMDDGRVKVIQPYVTMAGGFSELRKIIDDSMARGVELCPGGWGTPMQSAANLAVAASALSCPWFEFVEPATTDSALRRALAECGDFALADGRMRPPTRAGVGFAPTPDLLKRFARFSSFDVTSRHR